MFNLKRLLIAFCLFVFTTFGLPKVTRDKIKQDIEKILGTHNANTHIGIKAVSTKTGECFYHQNSHKLFTPASNTKLFTGACALNNLGAHYCFETQVFTTESGDLCIKASGDPSFSYTDLENLVIDLKKNKIRVNTIILDDTIFDSLQAGPGWMWDDGAYSFNSPVNGLNINHNCVELEVLCDDKDKNVKVILNPNTNYIQVNNQACCATNIDNEPLKVKRRWQTKENIIDITGQVQLPSFSKKFELTIENPTHYLAQILAELLKKYNIKFNNKICISKVPENAKLILTHKSEPLYKLVSKMLKDSDNLYAECLFKKLSISDENPQGTWAEGKKIISNFIQNIINSKEEFSIVDGSGGSRYNLICPNMIIQLLYWLDKQEIKNIFIDCLPIAGFDGTLKARMVDSCACGNVKAKTGTMAGVTTLSGYLTDADNEPLAFSIMINGFIKPKKEYETLCDKICEYFVKFSRKQV